MVVFHLLIVLKHSGMSSTNMKNNKFYFVSTLFIYISFALTKRNYFKTDRFIESKKIKRRRGGGGGDFY